MGPCNRSEERICTKKGEGIFIVKRRKRREVRVYIRIIKKRVHQTLEITSNSTSVFCGEEEWKKEDSTRLSVPKQVDSEE